MLSKLIISLSMAVLVVLALIGAVQAAKGPVTKLQIGIKKRAENCEHKAVKGDVLHIHYRGTLHENGEEFDSSYTRGDPLKFTLGNGQVIKGWDQGMLGICVGEKRKLVIPADMGYGSRGAPPKIPADAALVFEVECTKIDARDSHNDL